MNKDLQLKIIEYSIRGKLFAKITTLFLVALCSLALGLIVTYAFNKDLSIHDQKFMKLTFLFTLAPLSFFGFLTICTYLGYVSIPILYKFGFRSSLKESQNYITKELRKFEQLGKDSTDRELFLTREYKKDLKLLEHNYAKSSNKEKQKQKEIKEKIKELNSSF